MPTKSAKQHRAMAAAAAGRSTLGIPVEIGREMLKADAKPKTKTKHGGKRSAGGKRPRRG